MDIVVPLCALSLEPNPFDDICHERSAVVRDHNSIGEEHTLYLCTNVTKYKKFFYGGGEGRIGNVAPYKPTNTGWGSLILCDVLNICI